MKVTWLLWDEHNIEHIARHRVVPAEVEQVVFGKHARGPFREDRLRVGRRAYFGRTTRERALVVITEGPTRTGEAYVVTARSMTARERTRHLEDT